MESPDDPYFDVDLLERALALALQTQRFPPKSKGSHRKPPANSAEAQLEKLLTQELGRMRNLCGPYRTTPHLPVGLCIELSPAGWLWKAGHFARRNALIDLLTKARNAALDRLRLLPEPDKQGRWVRIPPHRYDPGTPEWRSLSDREQRALLKLAPMRMSAKELGRELGFGPDAARKVMSSLLQHGIVRRESKDGYVISRIPLGSPEEVASPKSPAKPG